VYFVYVNIYLFSVYVCICRQFFCIKIVFYWIELQVMQLFLQMGVEGWHWSCWTLIHWSGTIKIARRKRRLCAEIFISDSHYIFQVGALEIFLMTILNNGACMQTSLVVQEGLCKRLSFRCRVS